jgi:methionine-rich copper-binding protein CopC
VAGVAPDDTTWVGTAALDDDGKTVHLTTQSSMQDANYNLSVTGVEDTKGNRIDEAASSSFPGNDNPDQTPPEIVFRLPHSGETNVGVGQPVVVQFSEPMDYASVLDAFSWTGGGGPVLYGVDDSDGNLFVFFPLQTLQNNTTYNVMIAGTAQDWAGNSLVSILWSYTTTPTPDATPPTLSSSTPSNGATGVDVGANLVLTFSEPVLKRSLEQVQITPAIGDGIRVWSNDGRTVTIDPDEDMLPDTQYTLLIPPGGLRDLAGNGNVDAIHVVWSTGTTW